MAEIITKPMELVKGVAYVPEEGDVVIKKKSSYSDIFRYLQKTMGGSLDVLEMECESFCRRAKKGE